MAFTIRATTPADAEKLPAVERSAGQAFRSIPELAWIADDDPQTLQRHLELIRSGVSWVAVPEEAAVVAGESSSSSSSSSPAAAVGNGNGPVGFLNGQLLNGYLHIWEMSVDRAWQGRGIGTRLVQAAVDHATQRRYCGLTLTTFRDVPWNDAFYKARGFVLLEQPDEIPQALVSILNDEARDGLPRERRCAMQLALPY